MQSAPSVIYPVGRSRWAAFFSLFIWFAGVAATVAFCLSVQVSWPLRLAAALACAAAGAAALLAWRRSPRGNLHWDGLAWRLDDASQPAGGAVAVGLDLQRLMLLRVGSGRGARWMWAESARRPAGWGDFRRAVYSRASNSA